MRAGLVVVIGIAVGCGHAPRPEPARIRAKVVPAVPGAYYAEKRYGSGDLLDTVDIALILRDDNGAELTLREHFAAYGDLIRDDTKTIELRGRWTRVEDHVDVKVVRTSACLSGFGEPPCAHMPEWAPTDWRLRCRAMEPAAPSELPAPALVCELADGEPVPRYTVVLDGVRVLVVGGPRSAIRYTYD